MTSRSPTSWARALYSAVTWAAQPLLRRKLLANGVQELASQLAITATEAPALVEAIASNPQRKRVLVFDALDEADEPQLLVDQLLRPLAQLEHVCLVLGSRPDPGAAAAGDDAIDSRLRVLPRSTSDIAHQSGAL